MRTQVEFNPAPTLRAYVSILSRHKWVVLATVLCVPAAAYILSSRQQANYQSYAEVLLAPQALTGQSAGSQSALAPSSPETQAALARVPAVAERAVTEFDLPVDAPSFLADTNVSISSDGGILVFSASSADPALAGRIATAYARAYMQYRTESETAGLQSAIRGLEARLKTTAAGPIRNSVVQQIQVLQESVALRTADVTLIRQGGYGFPTPTHKKRNVVLGVILGLILGFALAFGLEAFDTRIRSADTIAAQLDLPMLARLPAPPREMQERQQITMLADPAGAQAEAFRMLRTNAEFATLGSDVGTLMVTSALEGEGKSTTIANLAVAFALAGRNVILVDLDLRKPFIHKFFSLGSAPGLTMAAIGEASIDDALVEIPLMPDSRFRQNGASPRRFAASMSQGTLQVISAGPMPPDPGGFIDSARLTEIIEELRTRSDLVLFDAPPLVRVGDGLALSAKVDAALVVTRIETLRRPALNELKRLLRAMPTQTIGFVVTNADADSSYGYTQYQYYAHPSREKAHVDA